jgi:hypothetical protein
VDGRRELDASIVIDQGYYRRTLGAVVTIDADFDTISRAGTREGAQGSTDARDAVLLSSGTFRAAPEKCDEVDSSSGARGRLLLLGDETA